MYHLVFRTFAIGALLAASPLAAQAQSVDRSESPPRIGARTEVMLGAHAWLDAEDLQPLADGSFDNAGFNLGGAVHWPLPQFHRHGVLLGVDFVLLPTESSVRFLRDDLILRGGYLTASVRWYPRLQRRISVDAGAGLYIADIAEVGAGYGLFTETELWEATAAGGYLGGTWNFGAVADDGVFVSFKVHFVDFGTVRDEDPLLPATLGDDAGSLKRGVYQLQFGYRWQ